MSSKSASRDDIATLAKLAGLDLKDEHFNDLVDSYRRIEPVLQRLPRARHVGDEPGHTFDPRRFMPEGGES